MTIIMLEVGEVAIFFSGLVKALRLTPAIPALHRNSEIWPNQVK